MKYTFTDLDERSYERKTKGEIRIEAEQISKEKIKISLTESGKSFIDLILSRKEAVGIINALSVASSECKCIISI